MIFLEGCRRIGGGSSNIVQVGAAGSLCTEELCRYTARSPAASRYCRRLQIKYPISLFGPRPLASLATYHVLFCLPPHAPVTTLTCTTPTNIQPTTTTTTNNYCHVYMPIQMHNIYPAGLNIRFRCSYLVCTHP